MDQETAQLDVCVRCCEGMVEYHNSCQATPFDRAACRGAIYKYLGALSELHHLWREGLSDELEPRQPFKIRPKCHIMEHLVDQKIEMFGSPAEFWCYADEDFVGRVKAIALRTQHPKTMALRLLQKMCLMIGLERFNR